MIHRILMATAALIAAVAFVPGDARAVDSRDPIVTQPSSVQAAPTAKKVGAIKRPKKKFVRQKKAPARKAGYDFIRDYHHAHDLIYKNKDYDAGIVALRALKRDENADVANLIGFSSRKLGRTEDAKVWYEKALASNPNHTRTLQYYGMWQIEQGNRQKAEENLETIRAICGTECEDFKSLTLALIGDGSY